MPASNSLNYANWVEIKVVGGGRGAAVEKSLMKTWGDPGGRSPFCSFPSRPLLAQKVQDPPHCEVSTKKGVFNKLGD